MKKKLNRRGKISLIGLVMLVSFVIIGFKIHSQQVSDPTAKAAEVVANSQSQKEDSVEEEHKLVKKVEKSQKVNQPVKKEQEKKQEKEIVNTKTEQEKKESTTQEQKQVAKNPEKEKKQEEADTSSKNETSSASVDKKNNIINPTLPLVKPSEGKVVYLTFDDGPSNRMGDLMNILDQYQAEATFFWLEPNMRRFPTEVQNAIQRGFSIGLHGVTHDVKKIYVSKDTVVSEMVTANQTLEKLAGITTHLIRTPYGSHPYMKPEYKTAVHNQGFILWDWNVDSRDWKYRDSRYVNDVIQQVENLVAKNIPPVILMHDRTETINHLPELLNYLKNQGYTFKKLEQENMPVQF
ncbi:polysaccharide deacetylase family protein [Heyndrickxia oleronia]|uniref:polysaccharide deacetylase family protein n=1 Tax=Heyndrickxia oleronia TaxID=38875 RepID=UPI001C0EEE87|nr:polysaccharide deacetylase family protein [Heyndrickxia oleronia]MBU5213191.1 polysaccharide deacetylase family protein [Heyndrickxia oleronia]